MPVHLTISFELRDYIRNQFKNEAEVSLMYIRDTLHPSKGNKERRELEAIAKEHGNAILRIRDLDS